MAETVIHSDGGDSPITDVAHDLGVKVIAKGVETQMQMEFLRQNNCDELQGTVFSAPLAEEAMHDLLAAGALG